MNPEISHTLIPWDIYNNNNNPSKLTFNLPMIYNSCYNFISRYQRFWLRSATAAMRYIILGLSVVLASGLDQAETLAWGKMLSAGVFEQNTWHLYLDVEAQTQRVMVTVVGRIPSEVEVRQVWLWISSVGVVNPSSSHMSRRLYKLIEAQIDEHCGEEVPRLFVEAHIEVTSDNCRPLHVDHLLQVVNNVQQAGSFRPEKDISW